MSLSMVANVSSETRGFQVLEPDALLLVSDFDILILETSGVEAYTPWRPSPGSHTRRSWGATCSPSPGSSTSSPS